MGICTVLLLARGKFGSLATHKLHSKDWSDWANVQADQSLCCGHMSFCCFVMRRLSCSNGCLYLTFLTNLKGAAILFVTKLKCKENERTCTCILWFGTMKEFCSFVYNWSLLTFMCFPWIWLADRLHSFCHKTKHGGCASFAETVFLLARPCFLVFKLFSAVCKLKSGSPKPVLTRNWFTTLVRLLNNW